MLHGIISAEMPNHGFAVRQCIRKGVFITMAYDFKKEYREFYMPQNKPEIVDVPKVNYIAVRGKPTNKKSSPKIELDEKNL